MSLSVHEFNRDQRKCKNHVKIKPFLDVRAKGVRRKGNTLFGILNLKIQ